MQKYKSTTMKNTAIQQYNNTTVQQYNNATMQQCNNATIQQCNNSTINRYINFLSQRLASLCYDTLLVKDLYILPMEPPPNLKVGNR